MKLKLDLHVHPFEAMGCDIPNVEFVGMLVEQIKHRGLDGIAVTEHHDERCGFQAREIVERYFGGSVLIIPGREVFEGTSQVIELFLPGGSIFRFVAHPRFLDSLKLNGHIQGIEIKNAVHQKQINQDKVRQLAQQHGLMLLENSDAHDLSDIGKHYNEVELEELLARSRHTA